MLDIHIKKQIKSVRGETALEVQAHFKNEAITGIYGNSGEGKSTLFNIIAGLSSPEDGTLRYNDLVWLDSVKEINLPTQKRNTGYIFQTNSLFPHFTVKENILFAVKNENQHEVAVSEILSQVDMEGMEKEAELVRDLGFSGKGAIHPKQIPYLNKVFTPDQETISSAKRVLKAFKEADTGLVVLDGKLIEKPVIRHMERIVAISDRLKTKWT